MSWTNPNRMNDEVPILLSMMWRQVSQRLYPASVPYMRKLGIVGHQAIPSTSIDQYFQVKTSGPATKASDGPEAFLRFAPRTELGKNFVCLSQDHDLCPNCGIVMLREHRLTMPVCRTCGEVQNSLVMVQSFNNASYGNAPASGGGRRTTTYMYKRTNHFLDHLKRVQAKETTSVKSAVVEAVENELRKERIYLNDRRITTTKVRSILKKLKLQKFYNHVFAITARLSGRSAPTLTNVQEEKLLAMFQMIQKPFERHCPPDRTNMISYSYVLRKLVEVLGWHDLVDFFPLLKSRQKVYLQDRIWKNICEDVGFTFFRSIS